MMDFEEISDMAVNAVARKGMGSFGNPFKLIRNLDKENIEEEIVNSIIILMFLASQYKLNLEDALLNKIEDIHKNGNN